MNVTRIFFICAAALLAVSSCSSNKKTVSETAPVSVNESAMNSYVSKLMKQMTLEEKLGQISLAAAPTDITTGSAATDNILDGIRSGAIGNLLNVFGVESVREYQRVAVEESRLGIPMLFGLDVIHGHRTVFPIPLALASSWDMEAIREVARVSATEASADGVNWVYSPMVDIARDPRWGRVAEGAGEDPFLGGEIAKAMVIGYQGEPGHQYELNNQVMACVKHFALYGAAEAGRDYNSTDMSLNRMYNEYLPPYKAAVEAGADSFMNSFNDVNGLPATANKWLLTDLLRNQWGFGGFVVTDYTSISEMIDHGMGDLKKVSELAINAGVDMDMVSPGFYNELPNSVADGSVKMAAIDQACRRVLEAKYKLGLFDDPYKFCDPARNDTDVYTQEHRDIARRVAGESIVLMKNDKVKGSPVLPLKKKGTVAVIGPLADAGSEMMGTWAVSAFPSYASIIEGIQEVGGDGVKVVSAKGSFLYDDPNIEKNFTSSAFERDGRSSSELLREALSVASKADVIVAALGESKGMSGEASSRTDISIPSCQRELLKALLATGKPVVLLLVTGRPLAIEWESKNVPAIVNAWFPGGEGAYAIADVLFGRVNPSAKITMSFPRNVGQIPVFYNHKNTGRPAPGDKFAKYRSAYLDCPNDPLYPFGYGLSYSSFEYSDISVSSSEMTSAPITASVTVKNTSDVDGDEIVQLYIRDLVGSITRPVQELKGFRRVHIPAGETVQVDFEITKDMLGFYLTPDFYAKKAGALEAEFVVEPGEFDIMIGSSSKDVKTDRIVLK